MGQFCQREKLYLAHPLRVEGIYKPGDSVTINGRVMLERYSTVVRNSFFSVGAFSFANNFLPYDIKIGRYCSIAPRVEIMTAQHPIDRFTTSPITYLGRWPGFARSEFQQDWSTTPFDQMPPAPIIGNDVWVGQDVLIKGGITIGDGACIAARAVVTRDVEPYAIVGGVPARLIKYRLSERHRQQMMDSRWWQYRFTDLPSCQPDDLDRFLGDLEDLVAGGLQPWSPGFVDIGEALSRIASEDAR